MYYLNRKRQNYEINCILQEKNKDYAQCLKNAIKDLVA
jgi:hypothetical protein